MHVLLKGPAVDRRERPIPFWTVLVRSGRVLDAEAQNEWLDDVEKRLREVVARIDPHNGIEGYSIERADEAVTIHTVTAAQVGKREIGLLSAGAWPCWEQIVAHVPEFQGTAVVFDGVARQEWMRTWDMRLQHDRACVEYGIY